MNTRRIHTIWKMIAINDGGHVLAVFPSSFQDLVEMLLPELSLLEKTSFKLAASAISATVSTEHYNKMPQWENIFISRLKEKMPEIGHLLTFSLHGDEILTYLPDILEGYRGNHIGEFAFSVDELHGSNKTVITLKAYDAPSLWQKFSKSERAPRQQIVLPLQDIQSLVGTTMQFELATTSAVLRLTRDGSIVKQNGGY